LVRDQQFDGFLKNLEDKIELSQEMS